MGLMGRCWKCGVNWRAWVLGAANQVAVQCRRWWRRWQHRCVQMARYAFCMNCGCDT